MRGRKKMTLLESLRYYADYLFHSQEYEKTGDIGEQHLYRELIALFGKKNIFRNLYLEKENGKTTEIDLLAIHSTGIYVFESKNYSGLIIGSTEERQWRQILGKKVYTFYNPILQNNMHIRALQGYLLEKYPNINYYSYIVFSIRCDLTEIETAQERTFVLKREFLKQNLTNILQSQEPILSEKEISTLSLFFKSKERPDETVRVQHNKNIQEALNRCPNCNGRLVVRYNKKTNQTFHGCENFPKCRYTKS